MPHFLNWLKRLVEPHEGIKEVGERRQAQLLSTLLIAMTLLMLQGTIVTSQIMPPLSPVLGILAVLMASTYILSRTARYLLAAVITVVILSAMNFVTNVFQADYSEAGFVAEFIWVVLPMLIASLYLSVRGLVLLWALNVGGLLVMQALIPALSLSDLVRTFAYITFLSILIIIIAWQRNLIERDRLSIVRDQSTKLLATNKELQDFTYTVSHDLRVPLVNLKGFAGELRYSVDEISNIVTPMIGQMEPKHQQVVHYAFDSDIPESLHFIESSVTRMDHLVNAVLKLSRVGQHEIRVEPIDMNKLVRDSLDTLAYEIEEKGVEVEIEDLPIAIADYMSMEQVVANILSNAVKYLDENRPGHIRVSGRNMGRETLYMITDNGRGIADGNMDKVFAPFRRAGSEDVPGEGMGLAYVQVLIRRHNGKIWFESALDKGTTFYFCVPKEYSDAVLFGLS